MNACGPEGANIEAHDYWARAALKHGNGAVYMLLHNHSTENDALFRLTLKALHLKVQNSHILTVILLATSVNLNSGCFF